MITNEYRETAQYVLDSSDIDEMSSFLLNKLNQSSNSNHIDLSNVSVVFDKDDNEINTSSQCVVNIFLTKLDPSKNDVLTKVVMGESSGCYVTKTLDEKEDEDDDDTYSYYYRFSNEGTYYLVFRGYYNNGEYDQVYRTIKVSKNEMPTDPDDIVNRVTFKLKKIQDNDHPNYVTKWSQENDFLSYIEISDSELKSEQENGCWSIDEWIAKTGFAVNSSSYLSGSIDEISDMRYVLNLSAYDKDGYNISNGSQVFYFYILGNNDFTVELKNEGVTSLHIRESYPLDEITIKLDSWKEYLSYPSDSDVLDEMFYVKVTYYSESKDGNQLKYKITYNNGKPASCLISDDQTLSSVLGYKEFCEFNVNSNNYITGRNQKSSTLLLKPGKYLCRYDVSKTNDNDNIKTVWKEINLIDNNPPEISILGSNNTVIEASDGNPEEHDANGVYSDHGITIYDLVDSEYYNNNEKWTVKSETETSDSEFYLTSEEKDVIKVSVKGLDSLNKILGKDNQSENFFVGRSYVNSNARYLITYTITDSCGNISQATRYIKLVDNTKPTITLTAVSSASRRVKKINKGSDFVESDKIIVFDKIDGQNEYVFNNGSYELTKYSEGSGIQNFEYDVCPYLYKGAENSTLNFQNNSYLEAVDANRNVVASNSDLIDHWRFKKSVTINDGEEETTVNDFYLMSNIMDKDSDNNEYGYYEIRYYAKDGSGNLGKTDNVSFKDGYRDEDSRSSSNHRLIFVSKDTEAPDVLFYKTKSSSWSDDYEIYTGTTGSEEVNSSVFKEYSKDLYEYDINNFDDSDAEKYNPPIAIRYDKYDFLQDRPTDYIPFKIINTKYNENTNGDDGNKVGYTCSEEYFNSVYGYFFDNTQPKPTRGSYTIRYNVVDAHGNENFRNMIINIYDPSDRINIDQPLTSVEILDNNGVLSFNVLPDDATYTFVWKRGLEDDQWEEISNSNQTYTLLSTDSKIKIEATGTNLFRGTVSDTYSRSTEN